MKKILLIVLMGLSFSSNLLCSEYSHSDIWLTLIKENMGSQCKAEKPKIGKIVAGNNGYRQEEWTINTCKGVQKYIVTYQPESNFPKKVVKYSVELIK